MLRLREERLKRGWSLTQLTMRTAIDTAALSKIERGRWPCGPAWRRRIAEAFGMAEEELFKLVGEEK
ncbi:MAG: helix-turn-helix transcriptional regulator [Firmicutes bacterium]|nr:helix-turn-helix transcriptional regulator [Bacillota bacterium]